MTRRSTGGGSFASFANLKQMQFDGINDYIDLDQFGNDLIFNSPASFSFWYTPPIDHKAGFELIFAMSNPSETERLLIFYGAVTALVNEVISVVRNSDVRGYEDAAGSYANVRHHFVITFDGTTNKFYHNGALQTTVVATSTVDGGDYGEGFSPAGSKRYRIMNRPNASQFGAGKMDEWALYDKALSNAEVSEIYNANDPTKLTDLSTAGNLYQWLRLGDGADAIDGTGADDPANRANDYSTNNNYGTPSSGMTAADIINAAP